jgi:hypothetical protein
VLRRQFEAIHGRAPLLTHIETVAPQLFGKPDIRQTVKAAKPTTVNTWTPSGQLNRIRERFLRPILSVKVLMPSEWRHWKRGHVEPVSAETRDSQKFFRDARIEDNNIRIVDSRLHRNQASGKMKRAGIFATKRRA